MDAFRKQLDALMEASRNGDVLEVKRNYWDHDVCRLYFMGLCPHDLFQLTDWCVRDSSQLSIVAMSEIFDGYKRQYCKLSANLLRKCTSVSGLHGEERKHKLTELKIGIDEVDSLIRRMDLEARSLPPTQKATLLAKLREYKSDLTNLKRDVKNSTATAARDDLLENGMADHAHATHGQRDRLLMSTERLNQSGERIKESRRTLLETKELDVSILQDLHSQRQTLIHALTTVQRTEMQRKQDMVDLIRCFASRLK